VLLAAPADFNEADCLCLADSAANFEATNICKSLVSHGKNRVLATVAEQPYTE